MATHDLPDHPDLDQLRTRARELQRRVRAGDHAAAGSVGDEGPDFPLAKAQLALARHFGFASWARLRHHVEAIDARTWDVQDGRPDEPVADRFVRLACLSYSGADSNADSDSARAVRAGELLAADPGLPAASLAAAVVLGDVDAVRVWVTADPGAASAPSGPHGWAPLMYLAFGRVERAGSDPLGVARLLLDAGADPNDGRFFGGFAIPFTVLTGVLGGGENDQPPHPNALPLARLLLERGAEANDAQALYNRMFRTGDDFLELLFEFGLGRGDGGPWRRLLPDLLNTPATLVHDLFEWAIVHDQRERVALLLEHGANVHGPFDGDLGGVDLALANGHRDLAEQVRAAGGTSVPLGPVAAFVAAALAADRDALATMPADVAAAARRARPGLMVWAASRGRPDVLDLLVGYGFDVDALGRGDVPEEQPWQTALHTAVEHDDAESVRRLLALGADRSIRDARFDGTAADWAHYLGRDEIAALLAH